MEGLVNREACEPRRPGSGGGGGILTGLRVGRGPRLNLSNRHGHGRPRLAGFSAPG